MVGGSKGSLPPVAAPTLVASPGIYGSSATKTPVKKVTPVVAPQPAPKTGDAAGSSKKERVADVVRS